MKYFMSPTYRNSLDFLASAWRILDYGVVQKNRRPRSTVDYSPRQAGHGIQIHRLEFESTFGQ